VENENLVISSNNLPQALNRDYWRSKSLSLHFLCTAILREAWKDKFRNFGVLHKMLCDFLDPNIQDGRRLFVSVFRGSFKTTVILGFALFMFCWAHVEGRPISIVYNTGTKDNAELFMAEFQHALMGSPMLQWIFGLPQGKDGYDKFTQWMVKLGEVWFTVSSLDTTQVSRHFDVIINDDLVHNKNAYSETEREDVKRKWKLQKAILTKYKKFNVGFEVDVGTLYHPNDLVSHIIKNVDSYKKFIVPYAIGDGRGRVDPFKKNGTLAFPEMFTWEDFQERKTDMSVGEDDFALQYELRIIDSADKICYQKWIRNFIDGPDNYWRTLIVDPAGTETKKNDPSGFLIYDVDEKGKIYIIKAEETWLTPYKVLMYAQELSDTFHIDEVLFEKEKYSISIESMVETCAPGFIFSLIEHHNKKKEVRIRGVKPWLETGRILFGSGCERITSQLLDYPDVEHDDLCDTLAYAVKNVNPPKAGTVREDDPKQKEFADEMIENLKKMEDLKLKENYDALF